MLLSLERSTRADRHIFLIMVYEFVMLLRERWLSRKLRYLHIDYP